jgi:GntR family transcriptional regulator, carbon starvation induced regulator
MDHQPGRHDPPATDGPPSTARTLVEAAYAALRRDILNGTLEPGMRLRAEALKERYAVSGGTLRESLTRLIGEALVTAEGQRGFRVAPMSLDDITDLTQVRKMIETEALRQAIAQGGDVWEGGVVAAFHRLSRVEERLAVEPVEQVWGEWEGRNHDFHEALLAGCQSRWLHHLYGILYQQTERYRRIAMATRSIPRDVHSEHAAIKEAALARDADLACRRLGEHIDRTLEVVRQRFTMQPIQDGSRRGKSPTRRP